MERIKLISPNRSEFNSHNRVYKDGTLLEKGVVLTTDFLERSEELLLHYQSIFCAYPDVLANSTI